MKFDLAKTWYKYSRNKTSIAALVILGVIVFLSIFAPYVTPYPAHSGAFVDFAHANQGPSLSHLFGTDTAGRDVFSRVIFAFRSALLMGVLVLAIAVPVGFILGMVAGFYEGKLISMLIMRITDIFLAVPALVLALAIASVLEPNLTNAMIAITVMWWPWYTRLAYSISSTLRKENYIIYAELTGGSVLYILGREILPNCISPVFTKMTLDMGWVIMMGASLSFVGLGEQPPAPALGNMVSDGIRYLPTQWWMTLFPALAIICIIIGFNLLGDGIRDIFTVEEG